MDTLEQTLAQAERAAELTAKTATVVARVARKVKRAASLGAFSGRTNLKTGLAEMQTAIANLQAEAQSLEETVERAGQWPAGDSDAEQSFKDSYGLELRQLASAGGMAVHEQDGLLVSFPTVIRVSSVEKSIQLDQKRIVTLRPSHVIRLLRSNEKRTARYKSDKFLEALYTAYSALKHEARGTLTKNLNPVVRLRRVYQQFTLLPGTSRTYTRTDFGRDLFLLESNGPSKTRKGARVEFSGSTGARGRPDFAFMGQDGYERKYYGIQFTEKS